MVIGNSYKSTEYNFAIEITRDNVHELIVWGKRGEMNLWDIYDAFIRAEEEGSKIYLLINTNGWCDIYATWHIIQSFQTMLHKDFVKKYRTVKDSTQEEQFTRKFKFTEVETKRRA